jgi:hypothetical protein
MGKFFSVTKKIEIAASKQHAAFGSGDVLADWQAIEIPRGAACLRSLTMLVRPKGDATPTDNNLACNVVFSKTNTVSLGTVNSSVDHRPNPDFLGFVNVVAGSYAINVFNSTQISTTGYNGDNESAGTPLVMTPTKSAADGNAAYDTIYVGIVANAAFDFSSINVINDADINSTQVTDVVMAGTSMDVRMHYAVGDVLHAQDDILLGTVDSISDAATGPITLTSATSGAGDATTVANGDTIYNLHPITLVLGFEK